MKRRILIWFLFLILMYLQYLLWFSKNGTIYYSNLQKTVSTQEKKNQKDEECNKLLEQEILYFRNSKDALEEKARYQFGMIKKDEIFLIIDDVPNQIENNQITKCQNLQ